MSLRRYHLFAAFPCAALLWVVVCALAVAATDDVTRVAGTTAGYAGDGGPALAAKLDEPKGAAVAADGTVFVADTRNHAVRRIAANGTIATVAGTGSGGYRGDGGPATAAKLEEPTSVAVETDGDLLIAATTNHAIRRLDATTGTITTVAGTGSSGFSGDGGAATAAKLDEPADVAPLAGGAFLIADSRNHRVRKVAGGTITTVAGDGSYGFDGDGGPATGARLDTPADVEPTPDGGYLVADRRNNRVRKVSPSGLITTEAGGGASFAGGVLAINAALDEPAGVAVRPDGSFLIAEPKQHRILEVGTDRKISVAAGTGTSGSSGDDAAATTARFNEPERIAIAGTGYLIVDTKNHRLRMVEGPPPPPAGPPPGEQPPSGQTGGTGAPAAAQAEPTPTPTPPAQFGEEPPAPPVQGSTVQVAPAGGVVKVRRPGSGKDELLAEGETLPVGTVVDTTRGIVRLTSAKDSRGTTQSADFSLGRFAIRQAKGSAITELVLEGKLSGCRRASARRAVAAAKRSRTSRKLWGSGKGRFRTRGRYSAATVRGTKWLTQDTCASTTVKVSEGLVEVRDLVRRKKVMVSAGESYTARKRSPRSR